MEPAPQAGAPRLLQIRASAGSGKTYALTSTYLKRLASIASASPRVMALEASGILAVTFTNAAANEMRERILTRLKELALGLDQQPDLPLAPARARQWLNVFLADASALNIRTIDSLLHQIVRASTLMLGISPDYETIFDESEVLRPLMAEYLEKTGAGGLEGEYFARACRLMVERGDLGFGKGDKVAGVIAGLLGAALGGQYRELAENTDYEALGQRLAARASSRAAEFLDACAASGLAWAPRKRGAFEKYATGAFPRAIASALRDGEIEALFTTAAVPPKVRELYGALQAAAWDWHIFADGRDEAMLLTPLLLFAQKVVDGFLETQREKGVFLQAKLGECARRALAPDAGVSSALCRMGANLHSALIDEFQDTSQEQWGALRPLVLDALARGGSLVWVGDVKQSIYGWRGGDANLFNLPCADAELVAVASGPKREELAINRRSKRNIVEFNNQFFSCLADLDKARAIMAALLPADAPAGILTEEARALAANYDKAAQSVWERKGDGGYVRIAPLEAGTAEKIRQESAEKLLRTLKEDIAGRRPWGDVLVLARGAEEAAAAARALTGAGIPVITEKGLLLGQNSLAAEIIALLEFIDNPDDDVALWTVLTGSILKGLPEAGPLAAAGYGQWVAGGREASLRQRLLEAFPDLWESLFAPFYAQGAMLPPYDLIREIGRRFCLESRFPEDAAMLRRLLELAHQLEAQGVVGLPGFLAYWREHGAAEKAPMPEHMDAVRIMTIHKAKGLQAPVVILPSTRFAILPPKMPVLERLGDAWLPLKSKKTLGPSHYRHMAAQAREAINLLYVAMTRAEEELYVFQPLGRSSGAIKTLDKAVGMLLDAAGLTADMELGQPPRQPAAAAADMPGAQAALPPECPGEDWRPMAWLPPMKVFRNQASREALSETERGILAHAALERINFDLPPRQAAATALEMAARALGMAMQEEERASLVNALAWFAALPEAAAWRLHGLTEQSLLTAEGKLARADLILPAPGGPLVIDYKTGRHYREYAQAIQAYLKTLWASGQFEGTPRGCIIYLDLRKFQLVSLDDCQELQTQAPSFM